MFADSLSTASDPTVMLAFLGLLGTIFTAMFKLLNDNTKAQNRNATAMSSLVKETAKGNKEAKQRNGHLGEQNIQITELITGQNKDIAAIKMATDKNLNASEKVVDILSKSAVIAAEDRDFLTGGAPQVVHEQTVEHQTVKSKE
jgi:hypothetical protein